MPISHRPLVDSPFGREIHVDPTQELARADRVLLRSLYAEHHLLVLRQAEMNREEQVRLVGVLGPILQDQGKEYVANSPKDGILGDHELLWHSDVLFTPEPYQGIALYAEELRPGASTTRFASCVRAYEVLPDDLRQRILELQAVSVHHRHPTRWEIPSGTPAHTHPVVTTHAGSGDLMLNVDLLHTARIEGLDVEDSERLLDELHGHLYAPSNTYEHRWQPHDLVVWDNRSVHHARDPVPTEIGVRRLRRLVLGTKTLDDQFPGLQSAYG